MVERYQPGQAQARALPSVTMPRADAESFGAQQGRALARAGQGVMTLAAQADQTQSIIDEARAKDAYSSTSDALMGVVSDFGRKRGRDAIDAAAEARVSLEDVARQGEELLESDQQKQMYRRAITARLGMFGQAITDHHQREALTYANQADEANVATLSQDLVASWNRPDERAVKWSAIKANIDGMAARNGWAPEVRELKLREAETSVYSDLTRRFLSKGDVGGAEAFYRENAGKFHGDAAAKMEEVLDAARERAERENDRMLARARDAAYGELYSRLAGGNLAKSDIDAALGRRLISGEHAVSLLRALRTEDAARDEPGAVAQLYRDLDAGESVRGRALDLYTQGQITKSTLDHFRGAEERSLNETPRVKQYRGYIRDMVGGVRGPLAVLDADASAREAAATREFDERSSRGEDPAQIADDIVPRYRLQPLSLGAKPNPRFLGGGRRDSLDDLERARQETARALQEGRITQQQAADEARLIREFMDAAAQTQQAAQMPKVRK